MPDRHLSFADDVADIDDGNGRKPSGIFTVDGSPHHDDDELLEPTNDHISTGAEGKVIPFNRDPRQPDAFIRGEIVGLRRLLEQVINFRGVSEAILPLDPNAAEIVLADADIRIGVRLHHDGADDHWEVWARSKEGSINAFPDKSVRLQFLSLSLSVMSSKEHGSSALGLGAIAHRYQRGEINKAYVQLDDNQTAHNFRIAEAVSAMRTVYGYVLRALPFDVAFQQLVG
jgi:hypothetical protein